MKVSDILKNITEIQNPSWVRLMSEDDIKTFKKYRWLVWNSIKLIKDEEVMLKLAEHLPQLQQIEENHNAWYSVLIDIIPKKKYSYIYPKKSKKKEYDYDFLKLLAKDLNESVSNCEDYYEVLEGLGMLEEEKFKLFSKYGIEYKKVEVDDGKTEQRNIEDLKPHPLNDKIYEKQFENISKLEKSIRKYGQLEPIVINSKNTIISGHRRFKVLQTIGYKMVDVRVRDFENEVEALINFNIQREKRGEDIQKEIQFLEREVYSKTQRGRKKKGVGGKVDKLSDYAKRFEISRTSASTLLRIEKDCPQLIKRIKIKGNTDGDITINKAYEICSQSKGNKTKINTDKELKTLKGVLPKIDRKDLLEVLKSTYPYSLMGSYSKLSNTTSFEFDESKFKRLDEKRNEMISNLDFLKTLDAKEILMYNKVNEVRNLSIPQKTKDDVFENLWRPTDIFNEEQTIEELKNLKPIITKTTSNDVFNSIRILTHSLHWKQNVGRNLKYIVSDEVSGKYLGLITIASDVVSIQSRDEKIGWNDDDKFKKKKINNSAIASTIVPTQPLGYNFLGTKLIASLTTSKQIRDDWENEYGDKLVGLTTTSLYGSKSAYNGIKWWRKLGTTSGKMLLPPNEEHYQFWHHWLKENYEEYYSLIRTENETIVSGPKQKILNRIFQLLGISPTDYYHENNRGVYYSPFYKNTYEFLRGEIGEDELEPNPNGVGEYEQIMEWWIVRAINRYKKLLTEDRIDVEPIWYDNINEDDVRDWLELRGKNPLIEEI